VRWRWRLVEREFKTSERARGVEAQDRITTRQDRLEVTLTRGFEDSKHVLPDARRPETGPAVIPVVQFVILSAPGSTGWS
jgi:hypothetical protein